MGKDEWTRVIVVAALGACVLGVLIALSLFGVSAWVQFEVMIVFMGVLVVGAYGFVFASRGGDKGKTKGPDRP